MSDKLPAIKPSRLIRALEAKGWQHRRTRGSHHYLVEPSDVAVWLHKPVPALDDEKPIDLIARGEYVRVASLISALEEAPFT